MLLAWSFPRPAALISARENPLPTRTLVLYFKVGQRTTGRKAPSTGLGAAAAALLKRAILRRCLRPG